MKSTIKKTILLSILCAGCIDSSTDDAGGSLNESYTCESESDIKKNMLALVNKARSISRQCGVDYFHAASPVTWNEKLQKAAKKHADDMADNNFFSHTGLNGSSAGGRVAAQDYNWITVGENIFGGVQTSRDAVEGWLDSPGHCANMMNADFKEMGVACVHNGSTTYGTYWVQVFGTAYQEIRPSNF